MANYTSLNITRFTANLWGFKDNTMATGQVRFSDVYSTDGEADNTVTFKTKTGAVRYMSIPATIVSYTDTTDPSKSFAASPSRTHIQLVSFLQGEGFFGDSGSGEGGATTFLQLNDVFIPTYFGNRGKIPVVNYAETGISLMDAGSFIQNNLGKVYSYNLPVGTEASIANVAAYINNAIVGSLSTPTKRPISVTEQEAPVILNFTENIDGVSTRYVYFFLAGKGLWGSTNYPSAPGVAVTNLMLTLVSVMRLTPEDVATTPGATVFPLGVLPVGSTFVDVANESQWNFSLSNESDSNGNIISFYFSYQEETDGIIYFALFTGTPGIYGGGISPDFTDDDFEATTNSGVTPAQDLDTTLGIGNVTDKDIKHQKLGKTLTRNTDGEEYSNGIYSTKQLYQNPTGNTVVTWKSTGVAENVAYETWVTTQINAAITSDLKLQGTYNASGNTWPVAANTNPVVASIKKGFLWVVSTAGTLGGVAVAAGDSLLALADVPGQTAANWAVIEGNVIQATETVAGIAAIATDAETATGTNDSKIITAKKLSTRLNALLVQATSTVYGWIKLAGDLGGTADAPKLKKITDLINTGVNKKAVYANPDGTIGGEDIVEFEFYDDTSTGYANLAAIQAQYPSIVGGNTIRFAGYKVICFNMTNPTIYWKSGDSDAIWLKSANTGNGWVRMT